MLFFSKDIWNQIGFTALAVDITPTESTFLDMLSSSVVSGSRLAFGLASA